MNRKPQPLILVALVASVLLAGCQPEEEEEENLDPMFQGCLPIENTVTTTAAASTCTGCTIDNPNNAADGNPASFATIRMPANEGGTATLRVTNPGGIDFTSGRFYGVLQSIEYGRSASASIVLRTFKDASTTAANEQTLNLGSIVQGDQDGPARFAFESTADFDAVEIAFTRADGTTSSGVVTARIHEFCSNAP